MSGRSTELCEAAVVTALPPSGRRAAMATLSASVALAVKETAAGEGAPSKRATAARASCTAMLASTAGA